MIPDRTLADCSRCGSRKTLSVISGKWLRERREALGLSQTETARLAGIQQGHLSRLEAGIHGCSPKTEAKLAKVLGFRV